MKKWIDLYKNSIEVGEELEQQIETCKKLPYYEKNNKKVEQKADLKKLNDILYANRKDRIKIVDEVMEELKNEQNELIKIIKNER